MTTTRYYRIEHAEALEAFRTYKQAESDLRAAAKAFAARYPNARPLYSFTVSEFRLYGLKFEPALTSPLWTKPCRDAGSQHPRTALPKKGITDRRAATEELKEIRRQWMEGYPNKRVRLDAFWKAIGTNWGDLLFAGCALHDAADGKVYVATSATLDVRCVEITGGEFAASKAGAA